MNLRRVPLKLGKCRTISCSKLKTTIENEEKSMKVMKQRMVDKTT